MASVVISGDTSGAITISAPAVSGTNTLTLPAATDTLTGIAATQTLTNKTLTSPTLTTPALGTPASGVMTNVTGINYDGYKNRIINGLMTTDQRNAAASQTFTAGGALAYSVDRWYGYCTGANVTGQQVAGSTTPTNTQFRYRFTGAASVTAVGFGQRIEQKNSYDLAGSTATLSADLAISATLTTVTWTASYATTTADTFGSLASPTVTQIATGTFTVSATVTNFNAQITVPAAATTGIQIVFTVGALTAGLTWTIGNVQLEKGSTATSFDYRPYGTELALCQRYYWQAATGTPKELTVGWYYNASQISLVMNMPVPMRTGPTLSQVTGTDYYTIFSNNTADGFSSLTIEYAGTTMVSLLNSTQVSGTAGYSGLVRTTNANSYVGFSAEL